MPGNFELSIKKYLVKVTSKRFSRGVNGTIKDTVSRDYYFFFLSATTFFFSFVTMQTDPLKHARPIIVFRKFKI